FPASAPGPGNEEEIVSVMRSIAAASAALALAAGLVTAAGAAPSAAGSAAGSASSRNPLGIVVVRFKPGTSAETMKNAIAKADGIVTTDLSKIGWMAATSKSSTFAARLGTDETVSVVASDKINQSITPDSTGDAGGTGGNKPALGNGPVGPLDPWHDLPSFLGETNPEGILQWGDNRMNVPAAWATSNGAGVKVAPIHPRLHASPHAPPPN